MSVAALIAAMLLSATDHELVWLGAGAVSLGALVGYFLSRSVGLPSMSDDIGDWLNLLGLAAVACEALVLICWIARSAPRLASPRLAVGRLVH